MPSSSCFGAPEDAAEGAVHGDEAVRAILDEDGIRQRVEGVAQEVARALQLGLDAQARQLRAGAGGQGAHQRVVDEARLEGLGVSHAEDAHGLLLSVFQRHAEEALGVELPEHGVIGEAGLEAIGEVAAAVRHHLLQEGRRATATSRCGGSLRPR